jgi:hypothetical protein
MANALKQWLAEITSPEQREADERRIARSIVLDAKRKAEVTKPYRESYERGLAEAERRVTENRAKLAALKAERRQGTSPDAASVESKANTKPVNDCEDNTSLRMDGGDLRSDEGSVVQVTGSNNEQFAVVFPVRNQRVLGGVEHYRSDDEDTELHCATCDGDNITLGARHGADEYGVEDSEAVAWCWDCHATTEAVEIALPASVLRRILQAVAA